MTAAKCTAPAECGNPSKTIAPFCRIHWYRIPIRIRKEIERHARIMETGSNPVLVKAFESLIEQSRTALKENMIGPHERAKCGSRHGRKGCGAEIIWLPTRAGRRICVEPETVSAEDQLFDPDKHRKHWNSCPYADNFRSRSRAPD